MGYQATFLTFLKIIYKIGIRVALNGTESNWKKLHTGVPQGSALGPLLFIVEGIEQTHEKLVKDLQIDYISIAMENGI